MSGENADMRPAANAAEHLVTFSRFSSSCFAAFEFVCLVSLHTTAEINPEEIDPNAQDVMFTM